MSDRTPEQIAHSARIRLLIEREDAKEKADRARFPRYYAKREEDQRARSERWRAADERARVRARERAYERLQRQLMEEHEDRLDAPRPDVPISAQCNNQWRNEMPHFTNTERRAQRQRDYAERDPYEDTRAQDYEDAKADYYAGLADDAWLEARESK